jgi:rfaE bifunctional protein nucleotidyltransferase chain/domain
MGWSAYLYDTKVIKTILSYSKLISCRNLIKLKRPNKRVVVTNGCFDILHAGHVEMLQKARSLGDYLIVGINSDASVRKLKGPTRPINNQDNRKKVLEALWCVDFVQIFNEDNAATFLLAAHPSIYVKATDYNLDNMNQKEKDVLERCQTKIMFVDFVPNLSTTKIVKAL